MRSRLGPPPFSVRVSRGPDWTGREWSTRRTDEGDRDPVPTRSTVDLPPTPTGPSVRPGSTVSVTGTRTEVSKSLSPTS